MKILAIETATESCSVALSLNGVLSSKREISPTGHSKLVLGMVSELLQRQGLQLEDLDAIAVDTGPGSFTGLRIGIGIAQGLAFGASLPVMAVSSLAALAADYPGELVIAAIDARMEQVYWALFDNRQQSKMLLTPAVTAPDVVGSLAQTAVSAVVNLPQHTLEQIIAVGSGWEIYQGQMPTCLADVPLKVVPGKYPEAVDIARIAEQSGATGSLLSPMDLMATYVRNNVAQKTSSLQQRRLNKAP